MKDWFGDICKKHEKAGDFDHLEGKGKPLKRELLEGDVLDRTIKAANFVPEWVQKRKEVVTEMEKVIRLKEHMDEEVFEERVETINGLIRKYNRKCPPVMQRGLVSTGNLEERYESWL
ncbi:DUF1992 domain-containing protein [Bacillus sp. H-16]|uniref:DnaJ family domain-containing protein n=1 Tax=Alteribacter salitolerans TaxID=2912333 RepID=UPI001962F0AD|nr:DUF1992 domain-containing protein [Alteribacter salitolerans]MBM7094501.1 DUF1992 domain-containing protein [Alteribacter salitolerans]